MSKTKIRPKQKTKKNTKAKKHKNSDTKNQKEKKDFIKKYPGFVIGIIFTIIVIVLMFASFGIQDPYLQEKIAYSAELHNEHQFMINSSLEAVIVEIDGEYEETLDDDYLMSMKADLEWLEKKEAELYASRPIGDVFAKEFAFNAFINRIFLLNEEFTFDVMDSDPETAIKMALEKEAVQNIVTLEEIAYLFEGEDYDKQIFLSTLEKLVEDYYAEKKSIITNSISNERKFVEAKKIILLSYS